MRRLCLFLIWTVFFLILCEPAAGIERFPPPDFESGYELPQTVVSPAREGVYEYIDAAVLLVVLTLSSYLIIKRRSRRAIFLLMLFSLLYFGFWRKGCVCAIGATQNIVLSVFDSGYAVGGAAILFFMLPLVFTLFFGRTFCAGVCPLGAIQDLVLFQPTAVPRWLESSLRLLAYLYLGAAVLLAATGSAFIICRYDPFVSFFRISGNLNVLIIGVCLLVIGIFIGRPYCRFLCPYGVILRQLSRVSKWRVTITPDECINCRLCEDSCPFGAIRESTADWPRRDYRKSKRTLAFLIILLPVFGLVGASAAWAVRGWISRADATVRLADRIYLEQAGEAVGTSDASLAFRGSGKGIDELYADASKIQAEISLGSVILGAFIGLLAGAKLIKHSIRWHRAEYEADRASCLACGRCYEYCPREHVRLKKIKEGAKPSR
ncbi:MAG: 4Fe-4S binding protein [Planctomycetota bacterium]|jgi:ferredoxin